MQNLLLPALLLFLAESVVFAEVVVPAAKPNFEVTPDPELLARIEALPDNTWLKLPPQKTAGDIGWCNADYLRDGPRIRDYCTRMVWAPERKRALYCGAGHNVHPYNDVWEYDLAANTWICLSPVDWVFDGLPKDDPDEAAEILRSRLVVKNGAITTQRGAPVRPAHTWWGLCYDSDKRRLVFWDAHKGLVFGGDTVAKALGLDPKDLKLSGSGPGEAWIFTFDPATRTWGEVLTMAPKGFEDSQLEYIPDQKALWLSSGKTSLLSEGKTTEWKALSPTGLPRGAVSAYDPERKTVVGVFRGTTFTYSFASNTWTTVNTESPPAAIPNSTFCYDSFANCFVLITNLRSQGDPGKGPKLWLYDLGKNMWTDPSPRGEAPDGGLLGYYDPERNVTVLYANRWIWVYRHHRRDTPVDTSPPSCPGGFSVEAQSMNSIKVSWEPSKDPESEIYYYSVKRNGIEISRVKGLSYEDSNLEEGTTYSYSVEAMNAWYLYSEKAGPKSLETPADTKSPAIASVSARPTRITVCFDEPVETSSAETLSNYALTGGVVASTARLTTDGKTLFLTVSKLMPKTDYTLTITRVRDRAQRPNTIRAGTGVRFSVPNSIVLVDFGATAEENTFELAGWDKVFMDRYTGYSHSELGGAMDGTTITYGASGGYNFQGVSGPGREFTNKERVVVSWFNKSANPITFTPNISFTESGRPSLGGKWHAMSKVTIPASSSGVTEFSMSANTGNFSLVSVNCNFSNEQSLICDKIELFQE